jgi:hypothetical protein
MPAPSENSDNRVRQWVAAILAHDPTRAACLLLTEEELRRASDILNSLRWLFCPPARPPFDDNAKADG